jgi:hypothetical protein
MRLIVLTTLLTLLAACQAGTASQDLAFVCTVVTAAGPVTQTVLSAVDPAAVATAGAAEALAAQVCATVGATPATNAVQAKPALRV